MNEDNNTTNPFEDAETNDNPMSNGNEMDFSESFSTFNSDNNFNNTYNYTSNDVNDNNQEGPSFFNQMMGMNNSFSNNNQEYDEKKEYNNQGFNNEPNSTFFNQMSNNNYDESYRDMNEFNNTYNGESSYSSQNKNKIDKNAIMQKMPIIVIIIILIVLLIILLKSVLGATETPDIKTENNTTNQVENDIDLLKKRTAIDTYKLVNGNILIEVQNKNDENIDVEVTIDYYGEQKNILNTNKVIVKNIAARSTYYESVIVEPEYKNLSFEITSNIIQNRFKEYYNKKVKILNTAEEGEQLVTEIKNNTSSTMDYINVYAVYYDDKENIIGFYSNSTKNLAADATIKLNLGYPKDETYKIISFSKYEVGINTAYSYKEK